MRQKIYDIIMADDVKKSIEDNLEDLFFFIPELMDLVGIPAVKKDYSYDEFHKCVGALEFAPKDFEIRMAILLFDIGLSELNNLNNNKDKRELSVKVARKILDRLYFSYNEIQRILLLIDNQKNIDDDILNDKRLKCVEAIQNEIGAHYNLVKSRVKTLKKDF